MNLVISVLHFSTIVGYCRTFYHIVADSRSDMPVCDGVEAAKRLRMLESRRKVPILLPSE